MVLILTVRPFDTLHCFVTWNPKYNEKRKKEKKIKRKENENLLRIDSICILRSQVNFDITFVANL